MDAITRLEIIVGNVPGRFLLFGSACTVIAETLEAKGWSGILVSHEETPLAVGRKTLRVEVHQDAHFIQTLEGYWVRGVTVEDIFKQFMEAFQLIGAVGTEQDREIWMNRSVQGSLAKFYVIGEDGHNEKVVRRAGNRAYQSEVVGEWLVMVHD